MASTRPPTRDADLEASSDDDGEERRGAADASAPGAAADAGDLQREWAARRARFWNVSGCACLESERAIEREHVRVRMCCRVESCSTDAGQGTARAPAQNKTKKRLAFCTQPSLLSLSHLSPQAGFREGRDAGHESALQPGFDAGFAQGSAAGLAWGLAAGATAAAAAAAAAAAGKAGGERWAAVLPLADAVAAAAAAPAAALVDALAPHQPPPTTTTTTGGGDGGNPPTAAVALPAHLTRPGGLAAAGAPALQAEAVAALAGAGVDVTPEGLLQGACARRGAGGRGVEGG